MKITFVVKVRCAIGSFFRRHISKFDRLAHHRNETWELCIITRDKKMSTTTAYIYSRGICILEIQAILG